MNWYIPRMITQLQVMIYICTERSFLYLYELYSMHYTKQETLFIISYSYIKWIWKESKYKGETWTLLVMSNYRFMCVCVGTLCFRGMMNNSWWLFVLNNLNSLDLEELLILISNMTRETKNGVTNIYIYYHCRCYCRPRLDKMFMFYTKKTITNMNTLYYNFFVYYTLFMFCLSLLL